MKRPASRERILVDQSLVDWMQRLSPRQRLAELARKQRMILALRRDAPGR
jgi:hypothetical protein